MSLIDFVIAHTTRGECQCGKCFDRGDKPDPIGHTADLIFFKVALVPDIPTPEVFRAKTAEHRGEFADCDPLDGNEHGYMELGGWIGDQGLAMQYMALGSLIGVFRLITPRTQLPDGLIGDDQVMQMAGLGMVSIIAAKQEAPTAVAT